MKMIFASKTGNVRRFVDKLSFLDCQPLQSTLQVDKPFILITYTTGFGDIPLEVRHFLKNNHHFLRGVAASGNRIWGNRFAKSADTISQMYHVPVLHKFELSGTPNDVAIFSQEVEALVTKSSTKVGTA
ncbi:class Ib ribonucleoside-diphosphate reductase assembly flavoprotein NrdI [Shouchella lonarensis]|uniref:Protein NrdI n=1 Tax=Shouchella lonarensis TaxID=1464122 RepID=A0A1G6H039_9BACI|nr:class Ib ribonucleoside-diphosphate reductase assembly flavoprotein NrdI [Shouchella lonarensis]SDB87667.1 protein involved in ribonucleotide reduction [Shouchella lonarensis]